MENNIQAITDRYDAITSKRMMYESRNVQKRRRKDPTA